MNGIYVIGGISNLKGCKFNVVFGDCGLEWLMVEFCDNLVENIFGQMLYEKLEDWYILLYFIKLLVFQEVCYNLRYRVLFVFQEV